MTTDLLKQIFECSITRHTMVNIKQTQSNLLKAQVSKHYVCAPNTMFSQQKLKHAVTILTFPGKPQIVLCPV